MSLKADKEQTSQSDCKSSSAKPKCDENQKPRFWQQRRNIVAVLAALGFFNVYLLRANLSIAVVAMTEPKLIISSNGSDTYEEAEFHWDSKVQGYVLSSFFYGYITSQILGASLATKIGGKIAFGGGIAVTAVATLLTPWLTRTSVYLLIVVRIIEGIFEGIAFPSIHAIWAKWAPPLERTRLATLAFCGSYVGIAVAMSASAYTSTTLGWDTWCYFVTDSPETDPRISNSELEFIQKALGNVGQKPEIKHPWQKILTSSPVWAIIVAHFVDNWGFFILLTQLPTLLKDLFNYSLNETGFVSSLPYIAMFISTPFSGQIADKFIEKKVLTTIQVRKLYTCSSFILQATMLSVAIIWPSKIGTITCIMMSLSFGAFGWSGFTVNALDIAPNHASVIIGISNAIGTVSGIISPIMAGYIVTTPALEEWQIVFGITSGQLLLGSLFYFIFASGEMQEWAK